MAEITNYKCMACGGTLQFSSRKQKLVCAGCASEYDVSEFEAAGGAAAQDNYVAKTDEWNVQGEGLVVYECKNCGGEVVGDQNMASTKCPYCDNPIVISSKFEGALKPNLVIPFKLNKHAAEQKLTEHINKVKLAPSAFKSGNHIKELKGVYVPFWLFDADVHAAANFEATKVRKYSDAQNEYTETSYFDVYREGNMGFRNVPADGSSKMDDNLMDSIEPYDVSEAVPYSSAYMAGYLADKYDVSAAECLPRADERIKNTAEDLLKSRVKDYNSVTTRNFNMMKTNAGYKYALYPVWILNTVWNGNKYTFAMNGQTGKLVGDVPCSNGKFVGVLLGAFAILAAIILAIINFATATGLNGKNAIGGIVAALIIALIIAFSMKGKTKSVHHGTKAADFVLKGSFGITNQYDNFIRKTTDSRPKNNNNNN